MSLSSLGNKYINDKEPWKTNDKNVLYNCVNLCAVLGLLIQPYLPQTSQKILKMLNVKDKTWNHIKNLDVKNINEPHILFEKLEDKKIEELKKKTSKITGFRID